jgi:putative transposase
MSAAKPITIRLYPDKQLKEILMKWLGTACWTYNKCLDAIVKDGVKRKKKGLRVAWLNSGSLSEKSLDWVLETTFDISNQAMSNLLKAFKSYFDKGGRFQMRHGTKKDRQQSNVIESKCRGRNRDIYAFLTKIKASSSSSTQLDYDSRIKRTRLGYFYLCIPKPLEIRLDSQKPVFKSEKESRGAGVVALDRGARTFHTCYNPSGLVTEWEKNEMARIYRLCHGYDDLQSRWNQEGVRHKKGYLLKKAAMRIQFKIRNLIDDMHKKMVHWLCANHRVVLLPSFETSQMLRKGQRRTQSKTARAMATWSHYRFKQRLLHKVREFLWCKVIVCDEHYTSKT